MLIRIPLFRRAGEDTGAGGTPPVTDQAAPPPAAKTVITGKKSEREIELETENEKLARELKQRETEIATVNDQFSRYKESVEAPKAPAKEDAKPATAAPKKGGRLLSIWED